MTTQSITDMTWRSVPIPESSPEAQMARLHVGADGAFVAMVRFPSGWSRPATGWYDHIEEVMWIDGQFEMSSCTYGGGDHTWFPAGYPRERSSSPDGALALAWFSGPSRWSTTPSPVADGAVRGAVRSSWRALDPVPSPLGSGQGRLLVRGAAHTSWILDRLPSGTRSPHPLDLLSLPALTWSRCEPGEALPALEGPVLCRRYVDAGGAC